MKRRKGQILIGAILLIVVLAILIPAMVMYVQNEARWSVKEQQSNNAFQLAEAAVDRGYQKIAESTTTWSSLQRGQIPAGFNFDIAYGDLPGGTYAISVTSGPNAQQATIIGVGRDKQNQEVRALKVVYENSVMKDTAISAAKGITMNGNNIEVEWGAVSSPQAVSILTKTHPVYYSAAGIDKDTNGALIPNDDANKWWWHSYYSQLPPMPAIDFESYKSSAIADGNDPCGKAYYQSGSLDKHSAHVDCTADTGKTYYIAGNWTDYDSSFRGNLIVRGNLTFSNGSLPTLSAYDAVVPTTSWKQYCNDWAYYRSNFDSAPAASPACFGDINNEYRAVGVTKSITPAMRGFVYVGGNLTLPNGGGSSDLLHGVIIVNGTADINSNSHCKVYYNPDTSATIRTNKVYLVRTSWVDSTQAWPLP